MTGRSASLYSFASLTKPVMLFGSLLMPTQHLLQAAVGMRIRIMQQRRGADCIRIACFVRMQ